MRVRRLLRGMQDIKEELDTLQEESVVADERATYELTESARDFSRKARDVVDDKLSFSATLMRADEVHAANRLLEEVERDVRSEEATLLEKMNEVKVARSVKRDRLTRLRLVRLVAVALAGSVVMGFSALGMAAAEFVQNREQDQVKQNAALQRLALRQERRALVSAQKLPGIDGRVRRLLASVALSLTPAEVRTFQRLTTGGVNLAALESFLVEVMPSPDLAREVVSEIASHVEPAIATVEKVVPKVDVEALVPKVKPKKKAEEAEKSDAGSGSSEQAASSSSEEGEGSEQVDEEGTKHEAEGGGDDHHTGEGGDGEDDTDLLPLGE